MAQHLSIRVPWHDNGWDGCVCCKPGLNQACRILGHIAEEKDDTLEGHMAGKAFDTSLDYIPPCIKESGAFMTQQEITVTEKHPFASFDKNFRHIQETEFSINPYSFIGIPYKWLLRKHDTTVDPHESHFTQYDPDIELNSGSGNWISHGSNQIKIFKYFYRDVKINTSLLVPYVKSVPFTESSGRIIIGLGVLNSLGDIKEYNYDHELHENDIPAYLWQRLLGHTIRQDRQNGFLFPFEAIQAYLKKNPGQNPDELIVIVPQEYFNEFSHVTEHLPYDILIDILNKTITVLKKYQEIKLGYGEGADWQDCIYWCKKKLEQVWKERGVFPGLGAVLSATGIPYGFDVANSIRARVSDKELWEKLPSILENIKEYLPEDIGGLSEKLTRMQKRTWKSQFYDKRRNLLELLSRFTLTQEQANLILKPENLDLEYAEVLTDIHHGNSKRDQDIIENPYILYEKTNSLEEKFHFGISQIDLAMFPNKIIKSECPIPEPSRVEMDDERRLRAIIASILEKEADRGNTLSLLGTITERVNEFRSDIEISISNENIIACEDFFSRVFTKQQIKVENDGSFLDGNSYQLNRLINIDTVIKDFINNRIKEKIDISDDWGKLLDCALKDESKSDEEKEKESHDEKVKAIEKMAHSRISVLIGGAGTGKTTTLAALCLNKTIQSEGIQILAPIGKARVVLSQKLTKEKIEHKASTIFKFLQNTGHCDQKTWSYYLSGETDSEAASTIIIDECSMLTEEMFGALVEAVNSVKRIIFVGDPNQLPPIGSGKPFYELANYLSLMEGQPHYAKLRISNRQKKNKNSGDRLDVEIARLFTEDQQNEVGDDIISRMAEDNENIEFKRFNDIGEILELIRETIVDSTRSMEKILAERKTTDPSVEIIPSMKDKDDVDGFDFSIGGKPDDSDTWMNFNDASAIENWQIISPYRNDAVSGAITINRYIHGIYRSGEASGKFRKKNTKKPLGNDAILYGEKVINVVNQDRGYFKTPWYLKGYPLENCENYIANGEVGIVTDIWKYEKNNKKRPADLHCVKFSSQPDTTYRYYSGISDGDSSLELAYSLTVHKAQGSGFRITVFVLNEPEDGLNIFLSRELLYTALTRQSDKVFILYNKDPWEIRRYSGARYSDLARRLTNLFSTPVLCEFEGGWYDDHLIHITINNELVRSKSEVIIANELHHSGLPYAYEKRLKFSDGKQWSPDFTIFPGSQKEIYWEHLGMLGNKGYRMNWERKRKSYENNGISEANGNLIITRDDFNGAFDAAKIEDIINKIKERKN